MKFSSEHHNWDLTLKASADLLSVGIQQTNSKSLSFAAFTGSMILSVAALESFLNSLASMIFGEGSDWECFERKRIDDKLGQIFNKYSLEINKAKPPFSTVGTAIRWRNSLVHSKPTFIEGIELHPAENVRKLLKKHPFNKQYDSYEYSVNEEYARRFYGDILAIIELLIKASGLTPRAQCSYILKSLKSGDV